MAKKTRRPAANDWSSVPCENALGTGFEQDDLDSLPISKSTWIAGAVYQTEPSAPWNGYFLPFANASDCLGWFRWWVLPGACLGNEGEFTPVDVELEGEFARVAEVIDNSEADQAEAILYYLAQHTEGTSGSGVLPAAKDPFKSVVEGLLNVYPLDISYLIPLSDLMGRCGTDADAWENLLGVPVKFSGTRMVLPAKGWKKVKTLIFDILDGSEGSVDCLVNPLTAHMDPDSSSDEVLEWLDAQRSSPKPKTDDIFSAIDGCEPTATKAIELLLKSGADIEARDRHGSTPLIAAVTDDRNSKIVELLLKSGADIEARDTYGGTPLIRAAKYYSNSKIVELLLKSGADIEARDTYGRTPLIEAAQYDRNSKIIELLIKAGANVNACDTLSRTLLHYAMGEGGSGRNTNLAVIKMLLKAGADVEAREGFGRTPLLSAVSHDVSPKVIGMLLKAGANVNNANADAASGNGETALMWAAKMHHSIQVMTTLLKAGADIEATTERGQTPLIWLARNADTGASGDLNSNKYLWRFKSLLKAGANIKAKDNDGKTAWDYAKHNRDLGHTKVFRKLLDTGQPEGELAPS